MQFGNTPHAPLHSRPRNQMVNRLLQADQFYGRGDLLLTPPGDQFHRDHQSRDSHEPDQIQLLQSISMTLSDMQRQLATIQEQNIQRDNTLYRLEMEMKACKRQADQLDALETPKSKKSRKTPRGLSACVRKIHASFDEEDQYHADEWVNTSHNQSVTNSIVKEVVQAAEYTDKDVIAYAAKKHHEYVVRQNKPLSNEQKKKVAKSSRVLQRRQRLYERRTKHAIGRERAVIKGLNEKFMSDEETDSEDSETFIKRTPKWRSNKLNKLIEKLDERYVRSREKKNNSKPSKARKIGLPSERPVPVSAPKWATTAEPTSSNSPASSVDHDHDPSLDPSDTPSGSNAASDCANPEHASLNSPAISPHSLDESDLEEDPEFDSWLAEATGVQA